jgi:hypothetical protein
MSICWGRLASLRKRSVALTDYAGHLCPQRKDCEIRLELGRVSAADYRGQTIWIADAHRDNGERFVVRADEKLIAFMEVGSVIRRGAVDRIKSTYRTGVSG